MNLKLKLVTILLGSVMPIGVASCSVGKFSISASNGGNSESETTSENPSESASQGSGSVSNTSQGGKVGDHTIYIDGDYDEENPRAIGGQTLDLRCLVDDAPTNKVTWASTNSNVATVSNGTVSFVNVQQATSVSISATSKEISGLTTKIDFTVNPCAINLDNSFPSDIEMLDEDGTEFSVPKKQSSLIFNAAPSNNFYAEVTFKVSDRDDALTRIGLMTGTNEDGTSLNGSSHAFYYYVHINSTSQNKTMSNLIGIANTNANKTAFSTIRTSTAPSVIYTKGLDCTLGLLRHNNEYYVFTVKNGTKTNITHYTYDGIPSSTPSYVWLGTSYGESGTGDNGRIAYTAKDFKYLTGAEATAIYNQYKSSGDVCQHTSVCNGFCLECGQLLAPLSSFTSSGYHVGYCTLGMDASAQFSVTYGMSWTASDNGSYCHGWAADLDTLNWANGGWSVRPDWWGWGPWNPGTGANNEGEAGQHQNIFSTTEMSNCNATVTFKYIKDTGVDDDGDYNGHIEIDCVYTSNVGSKRTMTVHYASRNFNVAQDWKCIYIDSGAESCTCTIKTIKINYGRTKGNGSDNFRVHI